MEPESVDPTTWAVLAAAARIYKRAYSAPQQMDERVIVSREDHNALGDALVAAGIDVGQETVYAWLIERIPARSWRGREDPPPDYWHKSGRWDTNALDAMRFPTQQAAEAYITDRSQARWQWGRAVEHGFVGDSESYVVTAPGVPDGSPETE